MLGDPVQRSIDEWCELFRDSVDKQRANEIIDAVNAKPTDHATVVMVCTHLLNGVLKGNGDPYFVPALMQMITGKG